MREQAMNYPDLDVNLTDEQRASQDMARRFATEVARPKGIELDRLADPQEVIDKGSALWDVIKTHRELGLHKRALPPSMGGMAGELDPLSNLLINEQLGYGDSGLAISLSAAGSPFAYAAMMEDDEMRGWAEDFANDTSGEIIGCWAITEPDHGSDWVMSGEDFAKDPKIAPQLRATKKGNHEYVLAGQKSAWVSNGTLATHASLHLSLEPEHGMQGQGLAIIPLDLPGIRKGKPLNKHGQRALNQGEIFFDDVVIPAKYMIVNDPSVFQGEGSGGGSLLAGANTGMSITFAGCAWSAFDEALKYTHERIQGGVPIFEHQNVKLTLMRMFQRVEAARSLSRRTFLYNNVNPPGSLAHAVSAKALSTETAFSVASDAVQLHGGNGLTKEYCVEKIMRDARASMIEDGTNEVLMLSGSNHL
jgi:alkylation response protein AidB-like acyl-CoA dehydrogenase